MVGSLITCVVDAIQSMVMTGRHFIVYINMNFRHVNTIIPRCCGRPGALLHDVHVFCLVPGRQ